VGLFLKIKNLRSSEEVLKDILFKHELNKIEGCSRTSFIGIVKTQFILRDVKFYSSKFDPDCHDVIIDADVFLDDLIWWFQTYKSEYWLGEFNVWMDDGDIIRMEGI
jgi:hypothetical protein